MSDGRDFLRNMWKQTTTNDVEGTKHLFGKDVRRVDANDIYDLEHMPNQKLHRNVSFIKSGVRILGFGVCWWSLDIGLTLLILAEVIGVGEELV